MKKEWNPMSFFFKFCVSVLRELTENDRVRVTFIYILITLGETSRK